jgi:hypothetical protein
MPLISGKYKRDSCLAYNNPATMANSPVPTVPILQSIRNKNPLTFHDRDDEMDRSLPLLVMLLLVILFEY